LINQVDEEYSPTKKQTTTQKTMTMLESNFKKVSLKINPTVIPFLTATTVNQGKKKKTLRHYVAPVNHNVINTECRSPDTGQGQTLTNQAPLKRQHL
jgi:hypothetical protein